MPKSVLVAAAEDSWSQTIVPRLIAAGADLDRVFRVEITADAVHSELIRPRDLACRPPPPTQRTRSRVRKVAHEVDAVLLILDPLISRLDPKLDSHKDADVRMALEPLVAMADLINISVLGTKLSVGKSARPRLFFGVPNSRRLLVSSSGSEIRVCTERATAGNALDAMTTCSGPVLPDLLCDG
jgi:hypothetical protein